MEHNLPEIRAIEKRIGIIRLLIKKLVLQLQQLTGKKSRRVLLYEHARLFLGRDASPSDLVNDDLGCAESVSNLISKVVKFPIITGTWTLNERLSMEHRFFKVRENSGPGTIIICATGTGNGAIRGHVGIFAHENNIMAASSATGMWTQHYTIDTWRERFEKKGGFETHYYSFI